MLKRLVYRIAVAFWRRKDPPVRPPRPSSMNPSDNVQMAMNLVMPLAENSPINRAFLIQSLSAALEEVVAGLHNTGIVHFARFTIVDGNLCMLSIYDGDFSNYIRDFIYNIGSFFDTLMGFVENPPPLPVEDHPDEFIKWVTDHDVLQLPESVTEVTDDLATLPRKLALLLDLCPDVQIFVYRAYPGYSVAQVRDALKIGW